MKVRLMHPAIGEIAFAVGDRKMVLGRAGGGVDVELNWDSRVSRRHARLWAVGKQIWFEDLDSRNGSWFGETKLTTPIRLEPGMSVLVGETVISAGAEGPDRTAESEITTPSLDAVALPSSPPSTDDLRTEVTSARAPGSGSARPKMRAHPRFVTAERVEVRADDRAELRELWASDISKGGLFVATDAPPPMGSKLEVRIHSPHGSVDLKGSVVHVVDASAARASGLPTGVGVQFLELTSEQRQAIQVYVDGLVHKLAFNRETEVETTGDLDEAVRGARSFLDHVEHNDLYAALELPAQSTEGKIKQRIKELRQSFSHALGSAPATVAARLDRAIRVLDRIEPKITDPLKRLEYDFRAGHIRAEERILQAQSRAGPSLSELRRAWLSAAPERVDRAAFLTRQAFAARQRGAIADAVASATQALEDNPFFDELRPTLRAWEELLGKKPAR